MPVITTAGHVDHGKTTLVRALTGMEPDRWAEEKRRGLTIGLGFAWTRIAGTDIAFTDVPGHERYVPTMLAGSGAASAVMFVVAADEGWMPQSTEHLDALNALDVRHGLLVVTRSDLADPEPARADALCRIARSSVELVDAVAVSAHTGFGLSRVRQALADLSDRLPTPDPHADVRLWIDRSFTLTGTGTVVTGTLTAGTIRVGDEMVLASTGEAVRVRRLQSLGQDQAEVACTTRVAVNIRKKDRTTIRRGDALLATDSWLPTSLIDVILRTECSAPLPKQVVVHFGTTAITASVRPLGAATARLRLQREAPLRMFDRVLLRDPGLHRVLAGAEIIDVRPPSLARRGAARRHATDLDSLGGADRKTVTDALLRRTGFLKRADAAAMGLAVEEFIDFHGWLAHEETLTDLARRLRNTVLEWTSSHPETPGMPLEILHQRLSLPDRRILPLLVARARMIANDGLVLTNDMSWLPAQTKAALDTLLRELRTDLFSAPTKPRLTELGLTEAHLDSAVRAGLLLNPGPDVYVLPGVPDSARIVLKDLEQPFTTSTARQALGTNRKVTLALLHLLDRTGVTSRLPDDTRALRAPTDETG